MIRLCSNCKYHYSSGGGCMLRFIRDDICQYHEFSARAKKEEAEFNLSQVKTMPTPEGSIEPDPDFNSGIDNPFWSDEEFDDEFESVEFDFDDDWG